MAVNAPLHTRRLVHSLMQAQDRSNWEQDSSKTLHVSSQDSISAADVHIGCSRHDHACVLPAGPLS